MKQGWSGFGNSPMTCAGATPAPGRVARCPHCDDVVLRFVRTPDRMCIDMRGAVRLEVLLRD